MNIVALVSYPFLPARSGGQKLISLFYKYFSKYHSVTCVGTKKNDPELADGYVLLNYLSDSPVRYINLLYFFRLSKIIREKKATHLIIEHPYYGWLGLLLKKICRVKLIVHSHNIEGYRWRSLGKWWWSVLLNYERYVHRRADYNFFITDEDKKLAIREFGLKPERCLTVTYGVGCAAPPRSEDLQAASNSLHQQYSVPQEVPLLLINGAFRYGPNQEALENLVYRINPLLQNEGFSYLILICGMDIPEKISRAAFPNVQIAGYVDDIGLYLKGCQLFLNPVLQGGGIKTKLVEALANNLNAVSTANGALGIDPALCNGKLLICPDNDWGAFAKSIRQSIKMKADTPQAFYDNFYWNNIAERAAKFIEG